MTSEVVTTAIKPSRRALFRNRDYMILWGGQMVSIAGSTTSGIARPLLVLALTGSAAQAGFIAAFGTLPYLIFSLPAGALVDRWNRKRVMIICNFGRAVHAASIVVAGLSGHLTILQLYVTAFIGGTLFVFFNLSEVAALPRVVTREQLPLATAQNQTGGISAGLVGSPLGGILFQIGQTMPFLADALSYAGSVASLLLIRVDFQPDRRPNVRSLFGDIVEGIVWLWHHPLIRFMALLTGGYNFTSSGLSLMMIILAKEEGAAPGFIGLVLAISSVGGIAGSLLGPAVQRRFTFGQAITILAWISAVSYLALGLARVPLLVGIIGAVITLAGPIYNVVQFSYRMAIIPDELQGRVNSVVRLLAFGLTPLGLSLAGLAIQMLGVVHTILLFGTVLVALALLASLNPHVRHAPRVTGVDQSPR